MMDFYSTEALVVLLTLTSLEGYVYFAMAFCLGVELLRMRMAKPSTEDLPESS
jgi:hypothetical protein